MISLVKDFLAFVSLSGFSVAMLAWLDILSNMA